MAHLEGGGTLARPAAEEDAFLRMVRMVAPGTPLREGLDSILSARAGALIVVGASPEVLAIMDGGFPLDIEFAPTFLYELSKLDGAVLVSDDLTRILRANALLLPDPSIPSFETGIRHRTAERAARATGALIIAISHRRSVVSLYRGPTKYVIKEPSLILARANQALATLGRYRNIFDQVSTALTALEFEQEATVGDVSHVVQEAAVVEAIVSEVTLSIAELGSEGRLVAMQAEELEQGVAEEATLVIRDYAEDPDPGTARDTLARLSSWDREDLLDLAAVARFIGLGPTLDAPVTPRGHRILSRVPRLPSPVIENIVTRFGDLRHVVDASLEELDEVDGIGEVRARTIHAGLKRLHQQTLWDWRS